MQQHPWGTPGYLPCKLWIQYNTGIIFFEKQIVRTLPTKLHEHQNQILNNLNIKLPGYL